MTGRGEEHRVKFYLRQAVYAFLTVLAFIVKEPFFYPEFVIIVCVGVVVLLLFRR